MPVDGSTRDARRHHRMMEMGTRPASQETALTGLHGSNRGDAWGDQPIPCNSQVCCICRQQIVQRSTELSQAQCVSLASWGGPGARRDRGRWDDDRHRDSAQHSNACGLQPKDRGRPRQSSCSCASHPESARCNGQAPGVLAPCPPAITSAPGQQQPRG